MTEDEWPAIYKPHELINVLRLLHKSTAVARKLRLYICECFQAAPDRTQDVDEAIRRTFDYADGILSLDGYNDYRQPVKREGGWRAGGCMRCLLSANATLWDATGQATTHLASAAWMSAGDPNGPSAERAKRVEQVRALCCALIRDIFGNPFRPVPADPRWLTPTVVALADAIYAGRMFDRLPVLADALEEAGCDNADILTHCRGDGPHVRGCWVVDLVLGKS